MSDTWNDLQNFRNKQSSLREKLARRKKEREQKLATIAGVGEPEIPAPAPSSPSVQASESSSAAKSPAPTPTSQDVKLSPEKMAEAEQKLLKILDDVTLELPCNATKLTSMVSARMQNIALSCSVVENLLEKFSAQTLICVKTIDDAKPGQSCFVVESVVHTKVTAVTKELKTPTTDMSEPNLLKRKLDADEDDKYEKALAKHPKREDLHKGDDAVESLLSMVTAKEKETKKVNDEIQELLSASTAKELSIVQKFKSQGGASVKEFCPYGTKEECKKTNVNLVGPCDKMHFKKIIHKHTDESLGDCSFLNTCFHIDVCKYVHYEIEYPERNLTKESKLLGKGNSEGKTVLFPPQWVQCDLRNFDMSVLGKFAVVMADPPWDIHMELPYGTMSDDEMRKLPVPCLQDDGYIFLWVTGRAMELGRECLKLWGYERCDELIWVKTNQLQRIIRTGRTGHWFNHGKEHCLIGVKGKPNNMNRGLDCDVIVAEVRATSHKPDEVYGIIERLAPGLRKIELFGRPHNIQPNWMTLGNQTDGVKLLDPEVVKAFQAKYPDPKMAIMPKEKHPEMIEAWKRRQKEEEEAARM